jgi:cell division protein YceG involved in septum cleavage
MRDKKISALTIAIVLVLGLGSVATIGWYRYEQQKNVEHVQSTHSITYKGENGQTVLALLKTHAYQVTIKQSSYGPFVVAIDGVKGGPGGKYWLYYVNGKQAAVGAAAYKTKNGETITWKLQ